MWRGHNGYLFFLKLITPEINVLVFFNTEYLKVTINGNKKQDTNFKIPRKNDQRQYNPYSKENNRKHKYRKRDEEKKVKHIISIMTKK